MATLKAYVSCLSFNLANNSNELNARIDKQISSNLEKQECHSSKWTRYTFLEMGLRQKIITSWCGMFFNLGDPWGPEKLHTRWMFLVSSTFPLHPCYMWHSNLPGVVSGANLPWPSWKAREAQAGFIQAVLVGVPLLIISYTWSYYRIVSLGFGGKLTEKTGPCRPGLDTHFRTSLLVPGCGHGTQRPQVILLDLRLCWRFQDTLCLYHGP